MVPVLFLIAAGAALCQSFGAADVHMSPPGDQVRDTKHLTVAGFVAADRYVIHRATLVDLIARAYNVDADKVLGGPPWVDYDRYEIDAKVKPGASEAALRTMLQSLLADRFGLAVKPDVQKAPGLILSLGKGNAGYSAATSDSGPSGCQQLRGTPRQGYGELKCTNADMDTLAASLRRLASTTPGQPLPIANQTGLDGTWDIDLKWDLKMVQVTANMSTSSNELIFDAINKTGLKLDRGDVPQPVLSILKATEQPTPNAANLATLLPALAEPSFDVESVKPCDENSGSGQVRSTFGPGGNVTANCVPIFGLIDQAWGLKPVDPQAVLPDGLGNRRPLPLITIRAKAPAGMAPTQDAVGQLIAPMLRALLIDRLKITFHTENRELNAPVLTAVKPKLTRTENPATERKGCNREFGSSEADRKNRMPQPDDGGFRSTMGRDGLQLEFPGARQDRAGRFLGFHHHLRQHGPVEFSISRTRWAGWRGRRRSGSGSGHGPHAERRDREGTRPEGEDGEAANAGSDLRPCGNDTDRSVKTPAPRKNQSATAA